MNEKNNALLETVLYIAIVIGVAFGTPKFLVYILETEYPIASITSNSMWPVLERGDVVFIKGVEKSQLRVGDIIVFRNSGKIDKSNSGFTIHRIISIDSGKIITKGDANNVADTPITFDKVIGRTVNWGEKPLIIPEVGKITIWISERGSK